MSSKTIIHRLDPNNPPKPDAANIERLKKLAQMPDEEIDFSDIPPLDEEFWQHARRHSVPAQIDRDIAAWLKQSGADDWQQRLNRILRQAMSAQTQQK